MSYTAELIADAIRDSTKSMIARVKNAQSPDEQDLGNDLTASLRTLAKLVAEMSPVEAKATVLDLENPERDRIIEALASKGIFF